MRTSYFLLVCLMTIGFVSCQKEGFVPADGFNPEKMTGSLHVDIGVSLSIHEISRKFKSSQQTEDFKVTVYHEDGTEAVSFESVLVMPDSIKLEIGNYYVEAHSDNNLPAAFENPYYYGVSEVFTIRSNTQESVLVNCQLANTIVSVSYSDNVVSRFTAYATTVSSDLDSLIFSENETRWGYFRPMPLNILVRLSYLQPDSAIGQKILSGQLPDPLPNRHYEILVDASVDGGIAAFQIQLDSAEVPVEVIEIGDVPDLPQTGGLGYGDLIITEIMYNPSALSDTEGEWFELYNHSDQPVNLKNLILGRDDLNRHTIADSIVLPPGEYLVVQRSATATDADGSYVYGSDISLTNTGAVLAVYNEGTESEPGALIFSVNYGGEFFPDGSGASICLNPSMLNATDAATGTSWCVSTTIYSTGDLGTPGTVNDPCL